MSVRSVVLIKGDGIGPEISEAVVRILNKAGAKVNFEEALAGEAAVKTCGDPLPDATLSAIRRTGVALKGPLTTAVGSEGGQAVGYRSLNVRLRKALDLFANVRPVKALPNLASRYPDVDLVIVRENTEGLYSGLEFELSPGVTASLKVSTRQACLRIAEYAFFFAKKNSRKKVTAVHKANILKLSDGLALECYREIAKNYSSIQYEERIVDSVSMALVMNPGHFDVIVTENLYGDILSDLAAGLIGGLGLAPSANIGGNASVFEAVHGSAPDIAGKGIANPTALLLSAVQMLEHLEQSSIAARIKQALFETFKDKTLLTPDLGGNGNTMSFADAVCKRL